VTDAQPSHGGKKPILRKIVPAFFAVSGIASHAECRALADKIAALYAVRSHSCLP
jgi:hypothetical protein